MHSQFLNQKFFDPPLFVYITLLYLFQHCFFNLRFQSERASGTVEREFEVVCDEVGFDSLVRVSRQFQFLGVLRQRVGTNDVFRVGFAPLVLHNVVGIMAFVESVAESRGK